MKIKKGDTIIVTVGKDKGKTGTVERVYLKSQKVLIPGLNIAKKHMKRRDDKNPGGIIEIPKPLPVANIAFYDPKKKKASRIGYAVTKGEKVRISKVSGEHI